MMPDPLHARVQFLAWRVEMTTVLAALHAGFAEFFDRTRRVR